jgi:hypothetical protein
MNRVYCSFISVLMLLLLLSGCYMSPVRHLAADIALLKAGETTQEDVIIYLGEPDDVRELDDGTVQWLYLEKDESTLRKTPLVGNMMGSAEFQRAIVTIKDGIVAEAVYSSSDKKVLDWGDDSSGQMEKQ